MPEPTLIGGNEAPPSELGSEAIRSVTPYSYSYDELLRYYWPPIVWRIILAGGCYPILVGAGAFCTELWRFTFGQGRLNIDGTTFGALPLYAGLLGAIGILWASIATIVTLPVVHLIAWSLRLRTGLVWLGAFSGGLVGFVAVLPLVMDLPDMASSQRVWQAITMLAVGPGLTTILGQIGGALGGRLAARRATVRTETHRSLVAIGWRRDPLRSAERGDGRPGKLHEPQFHFRIAHLLWIGVWMSVLLAVIRLSGIPYEFILPMLLGWLIYQAATLWIGWQLVRQLGPWWIRRRPIRRST
jgi:hypothetical protein